MSPPPPPAATTTTTTTAAISGSRSRRRRNWPSNCHDHPISPLHYHHLHNQNHHNHLPPPWPHSTSSPSHFTQNLFGLPHNPFPPPRVPENLTPIPSSNIGIDDLRKLGFPIEVPTTNNNTNNNNIRVDALVHQQKQQELKLKFGSLPNDAFAPEVQLNGGLVVDSLLNLNFSNGILKPGHNSNSIGNANVALQHGSNFDAVEHDRRRVGRGSNNNFIGVGNFRPETSRDHPQGFANKPRGKGYSGAGGRRKGSEVDEDREVMVDSSELGARNEGVHTRKESLRGERSGGRGNAGCELGLPEQIDHPGPPAGSNLYSVTGADVEKSRSNLLSGIVDVDVDDDGDVDVVGERLSHSLLVEDESEDKNNSRQRRGAREKDARSSDSRGQQLLSQRARIYKRQMVCRRDIDSLNVPFLAIYESSIPPEEEKMKQKQLLALLEKLVSKEWPKARLFLYGSCANSFGVSKSDIGVCLAIEEADMDKSQILMKLADILQSDNVQALTRARVPIVKLMDPVTGISCDICVNNLLAVVNTKLLRDYAHIDTRLQQLAFIIKHWAKSRGVNETYHGTLSSYAYVLMCIHFLQQRRPAILPCLQEMETTYSVMVDGISCAFFDRIEKLCDFGRHNKETIAQLVWGFFYYWAYCHDYTNAVISVRTGSLIRKSFWVDI